MISYRVDFHVECDERERAWIESERVEVAGPHSRESKTKAEEIATAQLRARLTEEGETFTVIRPEWVSWKIPDRGGDRFRGKPLKVRPASSRRESYGTQGTNARRARDLREDLKRCRGP